MGRSGKTGRTLPVFIPDPSLAAPVNGWLYAVRSYNAAVKVLGITVPQGFEPRPAGAPARVH